MRISFVGLVGALVALFTIGRLGQSTIDAPSTHTSVHLFTAALVVVLVATRLSLRVPATALVAGLSIIYVLSRTFVTNSSTGWSDSSAALTAVEISLATIAVMLAIRVARGLNQFEESVINITLDEMPGVMTLSAAKDDVAIEMSRARRHERPLTVTVVSFDPDAVHAPLHEIVRDVQQRMMQRYIMSGLARVASQTTRRGDIVVQDPAANRVIVLSPESSPAQLEALTDRLQESAYRTLGIPIRFGSAGFPNTALTFEDLVAYASGEAISDAEVVGRGVSSRVGQVSDGAAVPSMRTLYREVDGSRPPAPIGEHAHAIQGD